MPKAKDQIVRILEEAGVEYVFGLPGGGTMAIFDALYDSRIKPILVRHEGTAAVMADAYGRITGRPAVIMGQGLFMGSNATFGIMESFLSSSPMVVLTDTSDGDLAQHPSNQSGAGEYGSIDLPAIFKAMTKYTTVATTPKEAAIGAQLALKHAISGRPGPTAVVMRSASIIGEVDLEHPPFIHDTAGYLNMGRTQAMPADVERAASLLAEAKRPVIVAGNGARMGGAGESIRAFAEAWGIPVATSYKGKSILEETHPLALGMAGVYGTKAANTAVAEADVVLVVGAMLRWQDTLREKPTVWNPKAQKIIQIDVDPRNTGWTFPVDVGLVGDAGAVMEQIVQASGADGGDTAQRRASAVAAMKEQSNYYNDPTMFEDSSPVTPQRLVRLLHEHLDPESLITLDAGNNRVWMSLMYQSRAPESIFAPGGTAGMGWALPAALAVKLARPEKPAVAVTGDGGFMMAVQALSTAVQYNIPMTCVVMNDSSLGMVRQHQGDRVIVSEFTEIDHAALAKSFGADGVQVTDSKDLPDALRQAQASDKPFVVDVVIDRVPSPDDYRAVPRGATET